MSLCDRDYVAASLELTNALRLRIVDGWQMKVVDLYNDPTLFVRSPESDAEQKIDFPQVRTDAPC